jgi:2-C-methyl-D-erythritol 2,4-cyclodiphosphate synthase
VAPPRPPARSVEYLRAMGEHVAGRGLAVGHVDAYITLGTTQLSPHLDAMRVNVAAALSMPAERVSVKARTNDGLGPDGEGRAASANVVALPAQSS